MSAMEKLKLSAVPDDKPVRLAVELPAAIHRDLIAYAEILGRETGQAVEPAKLVAPMLARSRQRPRRHARETHDELSSLYSITSSARRRIVCGTVKPSAFAVLRFTTKSKTISPSRSESRNTTLMSWMTLR
jgi:hypothetical protein